MFTYLLQIINTEWGGLNSPFLPWTQYDDALDIASVNPGEQVQYREVYERNDVQ